MTPQSTFMVCAQIREGEVENLRSLLATLNREPGVVDVDNGFIPFATLDRLHVARLIILETETAEDVRAHGEQPRPWTPTLVFLGDVDGPGDEFLAELAVRAEPGLRQLFAHCEDFAEDCILLPWMQARNVRPAANYINRVGRTVTQIREESDLHRALRQELSRIMPESIDKSPKEIHRALAAFVRRKQEASDLRLSPVAKTPVGWWLQNMVHKISVPLVLLLLAPLALLLAPLFFIRLRMLERADAEIVPRPSLERIDRLSSQEDRQITNQFSAFGDVKPGQFRRYTLIFLLFMLDYSARHIYNKGYLTRVQTIHFARWVLLDDKRRLLFASNYDGSLESYMDDFINKVAWGLNLVFSNGVGYPRTRWLLKGGAEQEQKFKYYLRRHQVYTDVWYKAYPDLTGVDLARNTRIRKGLEQSSFRNSNAIRDWLSLI